MSSLKYLLFLFSSVSAVIVPEELPSLLSVAYSNIPQVKKGTDSRVGFGFSLGNHADFQVVFELGPQMYTNKAGSSYTSSSKRQIQKPKKPTQNNKNVDDGNKYLSDWSQNMKQKKTNKPYTPLAIPDDNGASLGAVDLTKLLNNDNNGEIDLSRLPNISPEALTQLKRLYGELSESEKIGLAQALSPKFVMKKTNANGFNAERLAEFNIDEDEKLKAQKRKVTEDLSDVSLDDE